MKIKTIVVLVCVVLTSCVSRIERPGLKGTIVDFDGRPIESCKVGEALTDSYGKYTLPETRHYQFLFSDLFKKKSPPLIVSEDISKRGYQSKEIYASVSLKRAGVKGIEWDMDTIYLQKKSVSSYPSGFLGEWMFSSDSEIDTLYFIKPNFNEFCKTKQCLNFFDHYSRYVDNASDSLNSKSTLKRIVRKLITVRFDRVGGFKAEKVVRYRNKNGSYRREDTSRITKVSGTWFVVDSQYLSLTSELKELNATFSLDRVDFEFMKWGRNDSITKVMNKRNEKNRGKIKRRRRRKR